MQQITETLEKALEDHNRPVEVLAWDVTPRLIRVRVRPLHRRLSSGRASLYKTTVGQLKGLIPDLEVELGMAPISIVTEKGELWIETPRASSSPVLTRYVQVEEGRWKLPLLLGKATSGKDLIVDLTSPPISNVLIGGTTGSGKTILLHSFIYGLCRWTSPAEVSLILVDTNSPDPNLVGNLTLREGGGLGVWRGAAHLHSLVTQPQEGLAMFRGIERLLEKRYREGSPPTPRYVVVIDELADLLGDSGYGDQIHSLIGSIAQISRKKGVHLIAATQRPSADVIKGMAKANFPCRVAMTTASGVDSRVIIDQKGAERLNGRGDGLLRVGMEVTRFQGALVEDEDVERVRKWGEEWHGEREVLWGEEAERPVFEGLGPEWFERWPRWAT